MRKSGKVIVKERHPDAHAERYKTNGREVYWLIRFGRSFMYFAEGKSESEAWKNAAAKLIVLDEKATK